MISLITGPVRLIETYSEEDVARSIFSSSGDVEENQPAIATDTDGLQTAKPGANGDSRRSDGTACTLGIDCDPVSQIHTGTKRIANKLEGKLEETRIGK